MIIQHIRLAGKPFGTVVATARNRIGISFCCPSDRFSKKEGVRQAIRNIGKGFTPPRRRKIRVEEVHLPRMGGPFVKTIEIHEETAERLIARTVQTVAERAKKYFKELNKMSNTPDNNCDKEPCCNNDPCTNETETPVANTETTECEGTPEKCCGGKEGCKGETEAE